MSGHDAARMAVVVGATGALGRVLVQSLQAHGLTVLAVARDATALEAMKAAAPGLKVCAADIASDDAIGQIAACLEGTVAMAVSSVGLPVGGGVIDAPPGLMGDAANIKVGGMVRLARAVVPKMARGSRLVAIGGHYGFEPSAYAAAAGAANAALVNLMRQLNWTHGPAGITSHLLAPGPMDTERLHRVAQKRAERDKLTMDQVLDSMRAESAIGELTTPEQVAWATTLLLAPQAQALAGSTLFLDSGLRRGLP